MLAEVMEVKTDSSIDLPAERLVELLHQMYLTRYFEEAAQQQYYAGKVHGTMHLFIGEEAVSTGAMARPMRPMLTRA